MATTTPKSGTMTITSVSNVKGRGIVATVDASGLQRGDLVIGMLLHQNNVAWKITGLEMARADRSLGHIGIVLTPDDPSMGDARPDAQGTLSL